MNPPAAVSVPAASGRTRGAVAAVLVVAASLLLPVALVSVWVRAEVLDTDRFVATAGQVARDPAVRREVSDRVGTTLIRRLDADGAASRGAQAVLPDALQGLAGPLATGTDAAIRRATGEVVASDRFEQLWETAVREAHRDALRLARGRVVAGLRTHDGRVVIDLDPVVDAVVSQLPGPIAALVPPVTTGDDIMLFRSDDLAAAEPVIRAVDTGWWIPPVACVLLLAAAICVSSRRRRVAGWIGCGIVVASAASFVVLELARTRVLDAVHTDGSRDSVAAVAAVFDALLDPLRTGIWIALGVGVAVAAGATVAALLHHTAPVVAAAGEIETAPRVASTSPAPLPGSEATTTSPVPVPAPPRNAGVADAPVREPSGNPRQSG